MLKLVIGSKGKGKTKYMLDTANAEAKTSDGIVIYLDKNAKHMFELDRQIRLINVMDYPVSGLDILMGFISGLKAGNDDIEAIYFDSFLTLAEVEVENVGEALSKLAILAEELKVDFILSLSFDEHDLPEEYKEYIVLSL